MKMVARVKMEENPIYRSYRCTNLDCFHVVETMDNKKANIMFYAKKGE